MSNPSVQIRCRRNHPMAPGADWCHECGEPPSNPRKLPAVHATDVECPTCGAWVGWACEGPRYGYHAAGYHPARQRAADRAAAERPIDLGHPAEAGEAKGAP